MKRTKSYAIVAVILASLAGPSMAGGLPGIATDPMTTVAPPLERGLWCVNAQRVPNFNGTSCVLKDPDEDRVTSVIVTEPEPPVYCKPRPPKKPWWKKKQPKKGKRS